MSDLILLDENFNFAQRWMRKSVVLVVRKGCCCCCWRIIQYLLSGCPALAAPNAIRTLH
jgi:hypothetical protein